MISHLKIIGCVLVYFNHFMAPKAIYTETLCTISSWAMDPPGPTLEPPMSSSSHTNSVTT